MRKIVLCIIVALCTLTACQKAAPQGEKPLPLGEEVRALSVTDGAVTLTTEEAEEISSCLALLGEKQATGQDSVNDYPQGTAVLSLSILCKDEEQSTSYFVYEKDGNYYAEQPYVVINTVPATLYTRLMDWKATDAFVTSVAYGGTTYPKAALSDGALAWLEEPEENRIWAERFPEEFKVTQALGDRRPMVRVEGVLYLDTGKESTVTGRCGVPDGMILSTVAPEEIPQEDDQSNFANGLSYQRMEAGAVEVLIDGKYWVFQAEAE